MKLNMKFIKKLMWNLIMALMRKMIELNSDEKNTK